VLPFYEIFLYFFIPGRAYPYFENMRITKDFISLLSCLTIGSLILTQHGFKQVTNIWIPAFLCFLIICLYKAPVTSVIIDGANFDKMWNWHAMFKVFSYAFLFFAVSSINLDEKFINTLVRVLAYCGFTMAIIMLIQKFNMDQVFKTLPYEIIGLPKNPEMGGTVGQATLSAPFIVMCLPFIVKIKKYFHGIIMIAAIVLSGSAFALLALCVSIISLISKNFKVAIILSIIIGCLSFPIVKHFKKDLLVDNGRFAIWSETAKEPLIGRFAITGAGLGAYKYLFALKKGNTWYSAHNEYLQLFWTTGLIGCFIVFMMIKQFIKDTALVENINTKYFLTALLSASVVSFGTFPLQLSVYQYYITIMIGVLYALSCNKELDYESVR
jgi:hypothetical protein